MEAQSLDMLDRTGQIRFHAQEAYIMPEKWLYFASSIHCIARKTELNNICVHLDFTFFS